VGLKNGRHTVEQYRDAGATRLVFFPPPLSPEKVEAELAPLAKDYIR
jgi:hypothetical protein